jgi:hypothetical protein
MAAVVYCWKIGSSDDCSADSKLHRFFTVVPVLQRSRVAFESFWRVGFVEVKRTE